VPAIPVPTFGPERSQGEPRSTRAVMGRLTQVGMCVPFTREGALRTLRTVAIQTTVSVEARTRTNLLDLVAAARPGGWIKNAIVPAAAIFALRFDLKTIALSAAAVAVFCAISSATYLINDVIDAPADRRHPVKSNRPIAAGLVSVPAAVGAAVILLMVGIATALAISPLLAAAVVAYLSIQVAYNAGLKREPIVDVMCIASGFVIRAIGGAVAVGVPVSVWFLLCVGLLSFYMGVEKRKAELRGVAEGTRAVLKAYSLPLLLRMESVATGSVVMAYALWAIERGRSPWMLATVGFVAFGLFRYQLMTEQGDGEAPEKALLRSPHMVVAVGLWVISCVAILYLTGGPPSGPASQLLGLSSALR
jgi:decaprenyl-phosphate phosphoribosyltransferase